MTKNPTIATVKAEQQRGDTHQEQKELNELARLMDDINQMEKRAVTNVSISSKTLLQFGYRIGWG